MTDQVPYRPASRTDGIFDSIHYEDVPTVEEVQSGAERAERLVEHLARNEKETVLLNALSVGNHLAEACRLSGLTRKEAERVLARCRRDIVRGATSP